MPGIILPLTISFSTKKQLNPNVFSNNTNYVTNKIYPGNPQLILY